MLKTLAAAVLLAAAACDAAKAPSPLAGKPASTQEVRALVEQFGYGGGDKDVAGEHFYNLAQRAVPGLKEVIEDPETPMEDLQSAVFIVSLYVPEPALYEALRTRFQSLPAGQHREDNLRILAALETEGVSLPYPR